MRFLSHTWRLPLMLAALIAFFVAAYMVMAKHDFEADKTASVLESQRLQMRAASANFERQTERALLDARSVQAGFNPGTGEFSPSVQKLFWENPALLAIEYTSAKGHIALEKGPGQLEGGREVEPGDKGPRVQALGGLRFAAAMRDPGGAVWRVVYEAKDILPAAMSGQIVAAAQRGRLLKRAPAGPIPDEALRSYFKRKQREPSETRRLGDNRYLISSARLGSSDVSIATFTPLKPAFAPVNSLFTRGLLLLIFAFCASLTLAVVLSRRLSEAFDTTMQTETAVRLQVATDTTRRETERKAAAAVSENVYPIEPAYKNGSVRLAGPPTSSHAGGWWFYFQRDYELYVFCASTDAESSALLLPASRALFSYVQHAGLSLKQIARLWDKSVYDCSKGKARMSAVLMQINVELGTVRALSAGGAALFQFKRSGEGFRAQPAPLESGYALGERKELWLEAELEMEPGERLLLGARTTSPGFAQKALFDHLSPQDWIYRMQGQDNLVALDFKVHRKS